ncbi:MAG: 7-carboxy-7-deazaguanine synthase QueE [Cyclobacteriaceae bacterium]|nr:7-carboxy-7-deazaguanine synthase QueE [Cyclobacteriaceae bacterium]
MMASVGISAQTLPVMEAFSTLQGEGFHTGKPAYFIRLGGCDVGCHWCDVKESWQAEAHPQTEISELVHNAQSQRSDMVVITGGEPLMYNLDHLCQELQNQGLKTHLETSGCYALSGNWDWICFSPKKFKEPLMEFYQVANELKIVIYHPSDLSWAQKHADQMHEKSEWYLQPEWSRAEQVMPLIVDYIKDHPKWRMSLQTHKYLNIP